MMTRKTILALTVAAVFGSSAIVHAEQIFIQNINATQNDFNSSDSLAITGTNEVINVQNGHSVILTGSSLLINAKTTADEIDEMKGIRAGSRDAAVVNQISLGGRDTKSVKITVDNSSPQTVTSGVIAQRNGKITVEGESFELNVIGNRTKDTYGLSAQGFGGQNDPLLSTVEVNAENTKINVTGRPDGSAAIMAYGRGHVKINGNLEVNTNPDANGYAIVSRGFSLVEINPNGGSVVKMNGGIAFAYNETTSGTPIDANVIINLDRPDSYWHGNSEIVGNPPVGKDNVTGMELYLSNKAEWTTDGDSFLNVLNIKDGSVNLTGDVDQTITIDELKGTIGNVSLAAVLNDDQTIESGTLKIKNPVVDKVQLKVTADGFTADDVKNAEDVMDSLNGKIQITDDSKVSKTLVVSEGDVLGALTQTVDEEGNKSNIATAVNTKLDGYSSIASLAAVQWRHETDTLLKRMGELRDLEGAVGTWVRIYGSEQEYGAQSVNAKNTTVQVGADYAVGQGWKVGGSFSYTDGTSSFSMGDSDSEMYGIAVYGTWLGEEGQFVDLIGKYSRLSNEFTSGTMKGDFDNDAFSLAVETGWHVKLSELGFVEPAVGLAYGRIVGDTFTAQNNVRIEQDDYDTLIARADLRSGFYFPNNKGNIYARVGVVHDFMGDMASTASKVNEQGDLNVSYLKDELGDTWVEYGIGANFNLSKQAYTFVDLEKTAGSSVKEAWKWTIGARCVF